jgi:hypothetical protein
MSVAVNKILKKLDAGDINSEEAYQQIRADQQSKENYNNHFLRIRVNKIGEDRPRVHVRIPLRILKTGLDIGAVYAPELKDLDLPQMIDDLHTFGGGSIIEVENFEEGEHVQISIDRMDD